MTEPLNREDVIDLLRKLGSEQDSEALDAARQVHAKVTDAGLVWEDLLVDNDSAEEPVAEPAAEPAKEPAEEPAGEPEDDAEDDPGYGDEEDEDEDESETPAEAAEKNAASSALIDKMLAKSGISDDFRGELKDYKKDIAANEFREADRRYVSALHQRLKKRS